MEPQSQLLKINKNEYLAQQKSKLEDALDMGLTKDEYDLICKKIDIIKISGNKLSIFLSFSLKYIKSKKFQKIKDKIMKANKRWIDNLK